jgi:hypothetical protein
LYTGTDIEQNGVAFADGAFAARRLLVCGVVRRELELFAMVVV